MIPEFVKAWDANKNKLKLHLATTPMKQYQEYEDLVHLLFEKVINPYLSEQNMPVYDITKMHVIDDDYVQGTRLFAIPVDTSYHEVYDYVFTHNAYGSCSGCDTLMGIQHYEEGMPDIEQLNEHMTLCLHLLQRCQRLNDDKN